MTLSREAIVAESWWRRRWAGASGLGLGLIAIVCGLVMQVGAGKAITELPDPRVMLPFAAATLALAVISFVRREPTRLAAVGGLIAAGAAAVMGWFLLIAGILFVCLVIGKVAAELL